MTPTPEDLARDLDADLALVEKATRGPWINGGCVVWPEAGDCICEISVKPPTRTPDQTAVNFTAIAASRTGWPAAIRRAKAAETLATDQEFVIKEQSRALTKARDELAEARKRIEELKKQIEHMNYADDQSLDFE